MENDKFYSVFKYVETEDISRKFRKGFNLFKFDDKREIEKFGAYIQQVLEIKENANLEKLSKSVFPYFFSWKDISYFLNCSYALCEFCNYWRLGEEIRGYLFKNY